ncbi:RING-type E3 ubiquitin transferase [Quillaja saponaria]|uniref:RING-type E3 ubiquitin transferase n=1 Tax=Quillaja saponaria TaxID=32244 RepID=A0AAD7Q391_QUISA|nr:RING-type E3 ubiquitin transferase [Quillaja saponaria]
MTTTRSAQILHHTTAFISEILSQSELRRLLVSTLRREITISDQITLKPLNLAIETLENAISTSHTTLQSSSLRLAEKLLLSLPEKHPISSFLLSLIYSISHRPIDAAISLLHIFHSKPSVAREEIAPILYEELFSVHLLPVFQWFDEQRSKVLPSILLNSIHDNSDFSIDNEDGIVPCTKSLSRMSVVQSSKLRDLERDYEEVLNENCRIFVKYFIEVLENENGNRSISPPLLVLRNSRDGDRLVCSQEKKIETEELGLKNGRYNPIWAEGDTSVEFFSNSRSKYMYPSFYPQRVSPKILKKQKSSRKLATPSNLRSESEFESSSASEAESEDKDRKMASTKPRVIQSQTQEKTTSSECSRSLNNFMADYDNPSGTGKHTPPKDFICPITTNLFDDPVTLETGQTYERKAIQEWFNTGNSTCPITRQRLHSTQLPKTNYVLKRLIASWQEQNPDIVPFQSENPYQGIEPIIKPLTPSTSPNSIITQATIDGMVSGLKHAINNLYMSEILEESEMAVLQIEKFWKEVRLGVDMWSMLSKPPVINGFVEILFNSVDHQVLQATVFLLAELGYRDNAVIQTLTQVDSDVECIVALFKKGLMEGIVLIYLLRPSAFSLVEMNMLECLITIFNKKDEDFLKMCVKHKTAAVILLAQILGNSEDSIISSTVRTLISEKAIESIIGSLKAECAEERIAAVWILLRCMQEDGKCRNTIADNADLAPILESFIGVNDRERFEIVQFFSELVKLHRRTFNEQVLHIIKDEGAFSTMHTLLIYLQTALQDQCPVVAGLLLQLDLLEEPRKMSVYREEAIDTLISCLRNTEFPSAQVAAARIIVSLHGRFTVSGNPLTREILLKRAGLEKSYKNLVQMDNSNLCEELEITQEEEKAATDWEIKMASVLVSHEFGLLFEALAEGLKSRSAELCAACFVSATWLIHMLPVLPDTGIQGAARVCLLKQFLSIFKSAKDSEEKTLSMLALSSFISYPEGLHDLSSYAKDILKGLRELKRSSPLASKLLKVLFEGNEHSSELWNHKELVKVDCSENGEVLSINCFKKKIFSGHSDGTIKVWMVKGIILHLIQETREHMKAVTSLAISQSGERLYSGSLDRTAKVWAIGNQAIHCVQVQDMKDHIYNLVVANSISCYISQGTGVKVQSWKGGSKLLNPNKYVKCLALSHGKLYCGCHDNSIQEIDLATGTISTIQSGSKKLLGKANPVHALQIQGGCIYTASSSLDGSAMKIWSTSNYSMVGSLSTTVEVRAMAVSSELIYLGCKGGVVEIWDKKKQYRVDTLQTSTNGKVLCMALDGDEEILVTGTSDGRIQAWRIN